MSINIGNITNLVASKVIVQSLDKKIDIQTYLDNKIITMLKLKKLSLLML